MMEVGHIIWEDAPDSASNVIIQGQIKYHDGDSRTFTTFGSYSMNDTHQPIITPSLEKYGGTIDADYLYASSIFIERIGKIV